MKTIYNQLKNKGKLLLMLLLMVGMSSTLQAQDESNAFADLLETQEGLFMVMIASFIGVVAVLMIILVYFLIQLRKVLFNKFGVEEEQKETAWDRFFTTYIAGKHVAVGKEAEKLMDHEYDGIREMDHTMPPLLKYIFIATILFAIYYVAAYMVFDIGDSQYTEYADELKEAELLAEAKQGDTPPITVETVERDESASAMANGKQIFEISCAPCHAKDGGGTIGPNLTDEFWIHGGSLADVFTVITEGVPAKGMIPWKDQLSPKSIQDVSNYVLSLQGKEPANPKEPQGEKYVPDEKDAADEEVDETEESDLAAM